MTIRRYYIPGAAVFITQTTNHRTPLFENSMAITLLRETLHNVQSIHPFTMLGFVFLPDHFHIIIQPKGNNTFSQIMHSFKTNFTKQYKAIIGYPPSQTLHVWQRRFWDHIIRNDHDFETHLHYIHYNPVKHGCFCQSKNRPL
ncbi:MAG: REP-associated tyrosine transposase [Chloroflexota bacterium]